MIIKPEFADPERFSKEEDSRKKNGPSREGETQQIL